MNYSETKTNYKGDILVSDNHRRKQCVERLGQRKGYVMFKQADREGCCWSESAGNSREGGGGCCKGWRVLIASYRGVNIKVYPRTLK